MEKRFDTLDKWDITKCPFHGGKLTKNVPVDREVIAKCLREPELVDTFFDEVNNDDISRDTKNSLYDATWQFGEEVTSRLEKVIWYDADRIPEIVTWEENYWEFLQSKEVQTMFFKVYRNILREYYFHILKSDNQDKINTCEFYHLIKENGKRQTYNDTEVILFQALSNGMLNMIWKVAGFMATWKKFQRDLTLKKEVKWEMVVPIPSYMMKEATMWSQYLPLMMDITWECYDALEMIIDPNKNYAFSDEFTTRFEERLKTFDPDEYLKLSSREPQFGSHPQEPIYWCPRIKWLPRIYRVVLFGSLDYTDQLKK